MNKKEGSRARKPGSDRNAPPKPRVQRTSDDFQRAFKERRDRDAEHESQPQGERPAREYSNTKRRAERPQQEDNVSLFLSPRMMELAEELAQGEKMNLRQYLREALTYILLAHGKRLGKSDKYVTEFVSQNDKKIGTWKSDAPTTEAADASGQERGEEQQDRPTRSYDRRPDQGDRTQRYGSGGDRPRTSAGSSTSRSRTGSSSTEGRSTRGPREGQSEGYRGKPAEGRPYGRSEGSAEGSQSRYRKPAEGQGTESRYRSKPSEGRSYGRSAGSTEGGESRSRSKPSEGRYGRTEGSAAGASRFKSKPSEGRYGRSEGSSEGASRARPAEGRSYGRSEGQSSGESRYRKPAEGSRPYGRSEGSSEGSQSRFKRKPAEGGSYGKRPSTGSSGTAGGTGYRSRSSEGTRSFSRPEGGGTGGADRKRTSASGGKSWGSKPGSAARKPASGRFKPSAGGGSKRPTTKRRDG